MMKKAWLQATGSGLQEKPRECLCRSLKSVARSRCALLSLDDRIWPRKDSPLGRGRVVAPFADARFGRRLQRRCQARGPAAPAEVHVLSRRPALVRADMAPRGFEHRTAEQTSGPHDVSDLLRRD